MVQPKRVGHLVLNVKNVQKSTQFYIEVLGFQVALQKKDATFLTCGKIHHDLALFQASPMAPPVSKGGLGLNHMALQVEDFDMLTQYYNILKDREIIDRTTDHGMTSSIYLTDPDGNGIELFCNNQDSPAEGLKIMGEAGRKNKELIFK